MNDVPDNTPALSDLTFPRQFARTQRLTLGEPRTVTVSPDGLRVVFCRSEAGDDPVNSLWVLDLATGTERIVADPRRLIPADGDSTETAEERARRERTREAAGGIVSYATDEAVTVAAFALAGRLFGVGLISGAAREFPVEGPVFDPRPDPTAKRIAYVRGSTLRIGELDGSSWELAGEDDNNDNNDNNNVTWGKAEFVAAEEMGRQRGFWWSPDGGTLAVERADSSPISVWHIADPAHPQSAPVVHRYPAAGTDNALVSLHLFSLGSNAVTAQVAVQWDTDNFPYLANVTWPANGGPLLTVQSRDQRQLLVLAADPSTGETTVLFDDQNDQWVDLVPGVPGVLGDGRLVMAADRAGARRVLVDGIEVSPPHLQVRSVTNVSAESITFIANTLDEPTVQHVWRWSVGRDCECITSEPGVHSAAVGGATTAIRSATLESHGSTLRVGPLTVASFVDTPLVEPNVTIHRVGDDDIAVAVLLPHGTISGPLPVLLDPYGGPHMQRVVSARSAYLTSQWFADQGFAVVVVDGRGTPGRGTEWERAVYRDLAGPVLDDQVRALEAITAILAADGVDLDRERVGIRGWSFGGYLAALAVLQRPDIFHAAVAGAPVTDWTLYDTHYTERYLGDPFTDPAPYDRSSLIDSADQLTRPLLLIHGLADDNVVAAHTLRLSTALLAAGKPHEVLPLSGVTHMTPQEVVAENLLLHQLQFLRRSLRIPA
jgi:dipeptidyl-peptidase-4